MELFIDSSIADVSKTGGQEYNSPHHSGQGDGSDRLGCEFSADRNGGEFFWFVAIVNPGSILENIAQRGLSLSPAHIHDLL